MLGVNFSSGIFSAYLKYLGATQIIISVAAAALYITRGSSSLMINKLSKIVSLRFLFWVAFLGSAISTLAFTIPSNPLIVSLLRTLQGIFSGIYWVLINVYAFSYAKDSFSKFKNLSSVTIWLNIGGFLGCMLGGRVASQYSPILCFYIGSIILLIGSIFCLGLKDQRSENQQKEKISISTLTKKEKLIITFGILTSILNTYIGLGIPLYILELGGSYAEIGTITALGILSTSFVVGISPWIRKRFSYKTLMQSNYITIIITLTAIFYFKSIFLIYFLQCILTAVGALERNLWYGALQEYCSDFNHSIGLLRGVTDYFGVFLFLLYGFIIQKFSSITMAVIIGLFTFALFCIITFNKKIAFLGHKKAIHINGFTEHFDHTLHRI